MLVQYGTDQEVLRELTKTLPVVTVKWQLTVMQASPTAMWDCYYGYCEQFVDTADKAHPFLCWLTVALVAVPHGCQACLHHS